MNLLPLELGNGAGRSAAVPTGAGSSATIAGPSVRTRGARNRGTDAAASADRGLAALAAAEARLYGVGQPRAQSTGDGQPFIRKALRPMQASVRRSGASPATLSTQESCSDAQPSGVTVLSASGGQQATSHLHGRPGEVLPPGSKLSLLPRLPADGVQAADAAPSAHAGGSQSDGAESSSLWFSAFAE